MTKSFSTMLPAIGSAYNVVGSTLDQWYTSPISGGTLTTGSPSANNLYAIPLVISSPRTIDQMAINVTNAGAGSAPRIGIYNDDGNNYPNSLLADAGTQSGGTTGAKVYTTNLPLAVNPGLYWLVYLTNGSIPAIRCFGTTLPVLGYASTLSGSNGVGWKVSQAYGALPSTFTAGGSMLVTTPYPAIYVRFSS